MDRAHALRLDEQPLRHEHLRVEGVGLVSEIEGAEEI
eukprot:COSAG06_NODE_22378_length_725_cov_1.388179_1_plen_36_part_01